MLWKGLNWRRTDAGQDPLELHDVLFDVTDNSNESLIVLPGWIWQIPIIVESLADTGTSHVAAHGNRDIRFLEYPKSVWSIAFSPCRCRKALS